MKTDMTIEDEAALVRMYVEPPFSVLQTMSSRWRNRKAAWKQIGLRSELGRGEVVLEDGSTETVKDGRNLFPGGGGGGAWIGTTPNSKKVKSIQGGKEIIPGGGGGSHTKTAYLRTGHAVPGASPLPINSDKGTSRWRNDRMDGGNTSKKFVTARPMGVDLMRGEDPKWGKSSDETVSGTSIFDPVLCELLYRWFAGKHSKVFDPFAGGSVRGVVAGLLGHKYRGVDLRKEQVEANRMQWAGIAANLNADPDAVKWLHGDTKQFLLQRRTQKMMGKCGDKPWADFILSCPPYANLEQYSDDPNDISNMTYDKFLSRYQYIIKHSLRMLKQDRFAAWVVGHVRDPKDPGMYSRFVRDSIDAFERCGVYLYNQIVLVTSIGSLPVRVNKYMRASAKVGPQHQYALIFVKGGPRKAREALPINEMKLRFLRRKPYHATSLFESTK